jgi:hypothetical protein
VLSREDEADCIGDREVIIINYNISVLYKGKSNPITGLDRPLGFQEAEAPRFQDNKHMKVVRLSALRTGRLYPRRYSSYLFLLEAESTPGLYIMRPE